MTAGPRMRDNPHPFRPQKHEGMLWIPGGRFAMGSDRHYPEEAPVQHAGVGGFWMDRTPVTNAQFGRFVEETGYVTFCELPPDADLYPGALADMLQAASVVFVRPQQPVDLDDHYQWWRFVPGANWRHPYGPDSGIDGKEDHPAVHIAFADAQAYADWAGKQLPGEAEWEFAARGGLDGAEYAWGDQFTPGGKLFANTWHGDFPWRIAEGFGDTSPVGTFPPNGYGLVDMIGNVWEWTTDWYSARHEGKSEGCCATAQEAKKRASIHPNDAAKIPRRVMKGGSFLCAPNYCRRYRPAARMAQPVDTSTCHLGFRCIVRS
ncbi:MAG: formylglycine-generating enzyme family protein [Alphaproteobacteria bacterium]